jgi:hypothetical protein
MSKLNGSKKTLENFPQRERAMFWLAFLAILNYIEIGKKIGTATRNVSRIIIDTTSKLRLVYEDRLNLSEKKETTPYEEGELLLIHCMLRTKQPHRAIAETVNSVWHDGKQSRSVNSISGVAASPYYLEKRESLNKRYFSR